MTDKDIFSSSSSSSSHPHENSELENATLLEKDKRGDSSLVSRESKNNNDYGIDDDYYDNEHRFHRSFLDRFMDKLMEIGALIMPHTLPLFIVLVIGLIGIELYMFVTVTIPFYNSTLLRMFLFVIAIYSVYCMYYNYLKACFTSPGSPPVYRQGVFTPRQLISFDHQLRRMNNEDVPLVNGFNCTARANAVCDTIQEIQITICNTCK